MKNLVLALALTAPLAQASDLTAGDWTRQGVLTALLLADYTQTVDICRRPETYRELNPLIRRHWSEPGIRNYFVTSAMFNLAVTRALPAEWRSAWQYGHIAFEVLVILRNRRAGVNFQF
jgi:hypothetical protein